MIPRYRFVENLHDGTQLTVYTTRQDVYRIVGSKDKSEDENNTLIDEYLKNKKAFRVYDAFFNEYQKESRMTAVYPKAQAHTYLALGLASEAGEVASKIKKMIRDNPNLSVDDMPLEWKKEYLSELGDVLWYIARISDEMGVSLSEIADKNISKLLDRLSRGTLKGSGDSR